MSAYCESLKPSEDSLADDDVEVASFTGTLSFSRDISTKLSGIDILDDDVDSQVLPSLSEIHNSVTTPIAGRPGPISVTFDIGNASVERDGRHKFVVYTIIISRSCDVDGATCRVNKRYSEFAELNSHLRRKYSSVMKEIRFPEKKLSGNFSSVTIAHRSRAFEQYLSHLFSIDTVRSSREFTGFFYDLERQQGLSHVCTGRYEEALGPLLRVYRLQSTLLGDASLEVVATLCALITCHCALEQLEPAHSYATIALSPFPSLSNSSKSSTENAAALEKASAQCPYLVPLMKLTVWLSWKLGRGGDVGLGMSSGMGIDKRSLEERLEELRRRGYNVDGAPTLLELITKQYELDSNLSQGTFVS